MEKSEMVIYLEVLLFLGTYITLVLVQYLRALHTAGKNIYEFVGKDEGDILSCALVSVDGNGKLFLSRVGIPNCLGFVRLAGGPIVATIFVMQPFGVFSNIVALGVWILAILTDLFDGYFARRNKEETLFGERLDPIADKSIQYLTAVGMLIQLIQAGMPEQWTWNIVLVCLAVILLREVVLLGVWKIKYPWIDPKPHMVSKVRSFIMAIVVFLVAVYLAALSLSGFFIWARILAVTVVPFVPSIIVLAAAFSVLSTLVEIVRIRKQAIAPT